MNPADMESLLSQIQYLTEKVQQLENQGSNRTHSPSTRHHSQINSIPESPNESRPSSFIAPNPNNPLIYQNNYGLACKAIQSTPIFSGKVEDYQNWKRSFQIFIMEAPLPIEIQYEAFIKSTINVPALKYFSKLPANQINLSRGLQTVTETFGQPYKIVCQAVEQIDTHPLFKRYDSLENLQKLFSDVQAAITCAQAYDLDRQYNERIKIAITKKLDRIIIEDISRRFGNASLEEIIYYLNELLNAKLHYEQMISSISEIPSTSYKPRNPQHQNKPVQIQARLTQAERLSTFKCPFDGENHKYRDCQVPARERIQIAVDKGLCLLCLKAKSHETCNKSQNHCVKCGGPHHPVVCTQDIIPVCVSYHNGGCYKTLCINYQKQRIRLLYDEAAGANLISRRLALLLNLHIIKGQRYNISGLGGDETTNEHTVFKLTAKDGSIRSYDCCVISSAAFGNIRFGTPTQTILNLLPPQFDKPDDDPRLPVEMLIGVFDIQEELEPHIRFISTPTERYSAQKSIHGTVIFGATKYTSQSTNVPAFFGSVNTKNLIDEVEQADTPDQDNFVENFIEKNTRVKENRIEVDLPVIEGQTLKSNYHLVKAITTARIKKWIFKDYQKHVDGIIEDWSKTGIIEKVQSTEIARNVHYLPYHIVEKPSSTTTKRRMVHNGSQEDDTGHSLNTLLSKGQTTWNLVAQLSQFRLRPYPLFGDLTKAFLQVSVSKEYRDLLRFFCHQPLSNHSSDSALQVYRFTRVPFGTTASSFLLFCAIKKLSTLSDCPSSLRNIPDWFYVDDLVFSFLSEQEVINAKAQITQYLLKYGFHIVWNDKLTQTSVLGLNWDRKEDTLSINLPSLLLPTTVREFASLIPKIFDPIGILEPFTVGLRRLFSKIWKLCRDWDAPINTFHQDEINRILSMLAKQVEFIKIPRYPTSNICQLEFHVLSDANDKSIGVVIYAGHEGGNFTLWFSKAKLHSQRTIPEAELNSLILAVLTVEDLIPIGSKIVLWTDSKLNYHRLLKFDTNGLKFHQARKIQKIHQIMRRYDSKVGHIPGNVNPADLLTKLPSLRYDWSNWISFQPPVSKTTIPIFSCIITASTELYDKHLISAIMNAKDFKSLLDTYPISTIIQNVQRHSWPEEYANLQDNKSIQKDSFLAKYLCKLRENIIMIQLRFVKDPFRIIIPSDHHLFHLFILHIHQENGHCSADTVFSWFSQEYYAKGARSKIKNLVNQCIDCKRLRGITTTPSFGPLPLVQTTPPAHAFERVGVDFAGPIHTSDGDVYIFVATCLNSRAVFLRTLYSTTADNIICVLRQMTATYGTPRYIYSDNAPNFKRTAKIFTNLFYSLKNAILQFKWHFSSPGVPQSNGTTERMVGTVKKTFNGLKLGRKFTKLQTETLIYECQLIINTRPLFSYEGKIITPHHLIFGTSGSIIPTPDFTCPEQQPLQLLRTIRRRLSGFWRAWSSLYLYSLRNLTAEPNNRHHPYIGQFCLFKLGPGQDRMSWPLAKIVKLYPSTDGSTRLVDIDIDGTIKERRNLNSLILIKESPPPECCNKHTIDVNE